MTDPQQPGSSGFDPKTNSAPDLWAQAATNSGAIACQQLGHACITQHHAVALYLLARLARLPQRDHQRDDDAGQRQHRRADHQLDRQHIRQEDRRADRSARFR